MALPTLSLTESQVLADLRTFLLALVPAGTEVIRGEVNRVPEPAGLNFIVFWPLRQERLGTNDTTYADNIVVGSVDATVLTVSAVTRGALTPGLVLRDKGGALVADTVLGAQLTGTPGGAGTYAVAPTQTVASETIYAGERADREAVQLTVQLDVHGPASGDTVRIIETLFRSEYGVDAITAGGLDVAPLYCSDPRQLPFINNEQQYEYRWSLDACFHINTVVGTAQQFAEEVAAHTVEAAVIYVP